MSKDIQAPVESLLCPPTTACMPQTAFMSLSGQRRAATPPTPPVAPIAPVEIVVSGVSLCFPFSPYPSQICLANQMIKAFKLKKHALLESPTGTGVVIHIMWAISLLFHTCPPQASRWLFLSRLLHGSSAKRRAGLPQKALGLHQHRPLFASLMMAMTIYLNLKRCSSVIEQSRKKAVVN